MTLTLVYPLLHSDSMRNYFTKCLLIVPLILILISCNNNPYNCPIDESIISKNDSIMALEDYRDGFTRTLSEMNEPLLELSHTKTYRLSITYSFDRDIWVYKIERTENGGLLTVKKTFQDYDERSDTTIFKELDQNEWTNIETAFNSNCFWTIPLSIDRRGLDGRNCVLEAYDPEMENPRNIDYFIAGRWSPEQNTDFRKICDAIEGIDIEE